MTRLHRFARFNVVSGLGVGVQLAVIAALVHLAGADYLLATAAGVTAAVVHNFVWHVAWTWRDRSATDDGFAAAFTRFALANGAVSLVGNLVLMAALVGVLRMPPVPANLIAIAACGVVNFELGDRLVFRQAGVPPTP